ncbi:hypothetical protein D3O62_16065 [Vibrio cholerae]|nr:hypothetical protein [Vibrio cholerae]
MRMLSSNDIKTVKRLAFIFNAMLLEEKEEKIALCVKNMPNYLFSEDNLLPLPNHVFFVWIGILKDKYYLDFWCMSKVKPIVYYDSKAYLSGYYLTELKNISIKKDINIIEVQNDFFEYFDRNKSKLNGSFDMSFLQYLEENEIYLRDFYVKKIDQYLSEININNTIEFIDINSIQSLFPDNEFATFYSYEVILRNNLAAASDIIRLLLLKKQGGMYVDLDTLPDISYVFKKTNAIIDGNNMINKNIVDIIKVEELFKATFVGYRENLNTSKIFKFYLDYIKRFESIYDSIIDDISNWDRKLKDFELPKVPKDLICLSSSKNNISEYNNNILSSHPDSKIIRILLRQMKKRYNYAKKRGFILRHLKEDNLKINPYYERLKMYRFDGMENSNNVTLIMSGPLFIMEILLGISYQLLSIDDDVSPLAISYALRVANLGLSFDKQTMFTPEHAESSWM